MNTTKRILLDTNAYSALLGGDTQVLTVVEQAWQIFFSTICLGELLFGFRHGNKETVNKAQLESFLQQSTVHIAPVSDQTAHWYANIFLQLKQSGTPIPINDVWIAAQTMELGATLITYDNHFKLVSGLLIWQAS